MNSRLFSPLIKPAPPLRRLIATTSKFLQSKALPPRPKPPPDSEIEESYLKGSGPGGQKINKTNSAVQLKHLPTGIVVKSQATRSRSQNRTLARAILAQKVDDLANGEQSRSAIVGEVKRKKAASKAKKSRRKYRLLEDNGVGDKDGDGNDGVVASSTRTEAESEQPGNVTPRASRTADNEKGQNTSNPQKA